MYLNLLKNKIAWACLLAVAMMAPACSNDTPDMPDNPQSTPDQPKVMDISKMTLEEKVGQMFIVNPELLCSASKCTGINATMQENLRNCPVGGVIFFGDNIQTPLQTIQFIEDINAACKYPPFIAVDEEGGAVARIGRNSNFGVEKFPPMLEIGNTGNIANAHRAGSVIGSYMASYGFNLDFAPVADIFSNPANTVIGSRSFGTSADVVSPMVGACADGLRSAGIFVTLKHFPGHGDTDTDSHTSLPLVTKTWDELLTSEIIPFRANFAKTDMIMTAHIAVTDVNEQVNGLTVPSTLSHNMLTGKLRGELGYNGIIITDALRMAAISTFYPTQGQAAVEAIKAGVDIILCPGNYLGAGGTYQAVLDAVKSGEITEDRINQSVSRIIALKNSRLK